MPRSGYTNFGPSEARDRLFEAVCGYLLLDQEEHSARVQALDYALRVAMREIERSNKMADDRLETYFQHYAEVIAQAKSKDATCTIIKIKGTDCLYELCDGSDTWHGWLRDGESTRDIKWEDV